MLRLDSMVQVKRRAKKEELNADLCYFFWSSFHNSNLILN